MYASYFSARLFGACIVYESLWAQHPNPETEPVENALALTHSYVYYSLLLRNLLQLILSEYKQY